MSMVIKNNLGAIKTLNTLNKNSSALQKTMKKVSSGMKIIGAKDDASGYAISEKMREQIRSLEQDSRNVQNGSTLFKIALGGVENIVEELRNLKELAINSANDTNTDSDRATIQKEFSQKMANINDIATTTNYNGKTLLDGTHSKDVSTVLPPSLTITENSNATTSTQSSNTLNTAKIIDKPTIVSAGDFTITEDGIYSLAENYTGTITINAQNVKLTQEISDTQLENVSIVTRAEGNQNLWIENLNIANTEDKSVIKFQGADNYLTVKGTNNFTKNAGEGAAINVGDGLTIIGDGTLNLQFYNSMAASIGSDIKSTAGDIIIADNVIITATVEGSAAAIGCGNEGHIGNITISGNANVTATSFSGAGIAGDITIGGNANVTATSIFAAGIGSYYQGTVGNITIGDNANVTATSTYIAGIGGYDYGTVGNITIGGNANVTATSTYAAGIGSYYKGIAGDITIGGNANVTATSTFRVGIGSDDYGTIGTINLNVANLSIPDVADVYIPYIEEPGTTIITINTSEYNPLKIHSGTKANQATNFFINDMHTKSLGTSDLLDADGKFINQSDAERFSALGTDAQKQIEWLETLQLAQNKTLDDISVTTKQNSNIAIRVLDGAIDYALDEATNVGAYLQRLDYTDNNITTMNENLQSAESTIRDADIAKTFTAYTKMNVLTQAAQSILAQANQSSSQVLSLLQ